MSLLALGVFFAASSAAVRAQTATPSPAQVFTRPRTVGATQTQTQTEQARPPADTAPAAQTQNQRTAPQDARPAPQDEPTPATQRQTPVASPNATTATTPVAVPTLPVDASTVPAVPLQPARPLSLNRIEARITEAERLLKSRVTTTGSTPNISWVTLAAYDQDSSQMHLLTLPKQTFITRGAEVTMTT
ncbi:MAG TPA: hypothetical protein VFX96_11080, partial [Pyrinomonadaceae bacterium]|nr:hypothetical protein [Pyrinomonadaceae bacterium]